VLEEHGEAGSISDLRRLGHEEPEYLDPACGIRSSVQQPGAGFLGGWVGAKVGANVHSHQATPGDVQRPLPQMCATPVDVGLRQATGRS
jgi:hypothetical protein